MYLSQGYLAFLCSVGVCLIGLVLVGLPGPVWSQGVQDQVISDGGGGDGDRQAMSQRFAQSSAPRRGELSYSRFVEEVEQGRVRSVTMTGPRLTARFHDGRSGQTYVPESDESELVSLLQAHDVAITAEPEQSGASLASALVWLLPIALLIGLWIFVMRQMQGAGGNAMEFKKSKARQLSRGTGRTRFKDVAGIDEARDDLQEIVEFLRDPGKFLRLGGRIPSGVLLIGQPGTGKTLVARAVAGEAQVPFFSISGSEFVEMFVGVGASRVRDMFEDAKKNAPCIVFIDEIDALGRKRGSGMGGGHDEREQTLNQLLVEMDGFEPNTSVIVIAATNRPDVLDPALLRPGRFDRQVMVPNPDLGGREQILRVHTRKVPLGPDVDLKIVARGTPGFSGAELANLVNEAALLSARRSKRSVGRAEFEDAKDKLIMGAERATMVMSDEERERAAYHESGHALVALHLPASDPVHKVTVIPRAQSLGMMVRLPERDRMSLTRAKCRADLAVAMGGRVAEELVFGPETVTSSAQADIQSATDLARAMVTRFGMSHNLGPLAYGEDEQEAFAGQPVSRRQQVSDLTQRRVDEEVKQIIAEGYETAHRILTERLNDLHAAAEGLREYETLSGEQLRRLLAGQPVDAPQAPAEGPAVQSG